MNALERLRAGEILILPTDSLPGLHVRARLADAQARLRAAKGSADTRPFLLLVADVDTALAIGRPHAAHRALLAAAWPGPYSFLLEPTRDCPADWIGTEGRVALRVPAHAALRELLAALGEPLFSTSANRAGQAAAADLDAAREAFPDLVAASLGAQRPQGSPSTLVDLGQAEARLLRPGAGPWPLPGRG